MIAPSDYARLDRAVRRILPTMLRAFSSGAADAHALERLRPLTTSDDAEGAYDLVNDMGDRRHMDLAHALYFTSRALALAAGMAVVRNQSDELEAVGDPADIDYWLSGLDGAAARTLPTTQMDTLRASEPVAMRRSA